MVGQAAIRDDDEEEYRCLVSNHSLQLNTSKTKELVTDPHLDQF